MKFKNLIFTCLIAVTISGCAMDGTKQVTIVDKDSKEIKDIVVFPLYQSSYGIAFGPDGKGIHLGSKAFIKPFVISSGDDLIKKKINGRGIIIPPFIYIGTSKYVGRYLITKKGYAPKIVYESMIYSEPKIVMSASVNNDHEKIIDKMLASDIDQKHIKRTFNSEHLDEKIQIGLDSSDIALLKANR